MEPKTPPEKTDEELGMCFVYCPVCGERYWAEDGHECAFADGDEPEEDE